MKRFNETLFTNVMNEFDRQQFLLVQSLSNISFLKKIKANYITSSVYHHKMLH